MASEEPATVRELLRGINLDAPAGRVLLYLHGGRS